MKTIVKWLNNPVVLSILLVLGFTTDLVLLGRSYDLNKGEWASWVQAVGSVIAIAGAFWIGKHQADVQTRLAEEARKHVLSDRHATIKGALDRAFQLFLNVHEHLRSPADAPARGLVFHYIKAQAPAAQRLLDEIPLYDLGSDVLVHAVLDLRGTVQSMLSTAEWTTRSIEGPADGIPLPPDTASIWLSFYIEQARPAYLAAINVTGGEPRSKPEVLR